MVRHQRILTCSLISRKIYQSFFSGFKISQGVHSCRHVCMLACRNSLEIQDLCHSITICAKEPQKYQAFKQAIEKISSKGMPG